jgi:multidrug efflux pump subunit AcrA (membrane-fusion protein)
MTEAGAILGTPAYMAPEQARGGAANHRSDLFSLGCVLYHAATGERPFRGPDSFAVLTAVAQHQPRPPRALSPELPPALAEMILRLLAKDPDDRLPTAEAVGQALEAMPLDTVAAPPAAGGAAETLVGGGRPARRRRWEIRAPAVLAALLGTALAWAALVTTDAVVRAPGRVRPPRAPQKVISPARGEVLTDGPLRVKGVFRHEGDLVKQGDVLIELEASRLERGITQQQQAIRALEAEVDATKADLRQAREGRESDLRLARVALKEAEERVNTAKKLRDKNVISNEEYAGALTRLEEAKERVANLSKPLSEAKYILPQLQLTKARNELETLQQDREQAFLRAPKDGVVTSGDVQVGDVLEPGKPVMEVVEKGFLFEVTVPGEEVGRLEVGMPARVRLDAFDYQRYGTAQGTVCFLSPDARIIEGQQGTFYTVRVALESDEVGQGGYRGQLKLGMAGVAEVVTGRETLLSRLLKKLR